MTLRELMEKILEILPDAEMAENWDGQLKIYTGLMAGEMIPDKVDYQLVKFEHKVEKE